MELFALEKKKGFSDKVYVFLLVKKTSVTWERKCSSFPNAAAKNSILHQKTVFANVISNKGILNDQTSEITVSEK